MNTVRTLPLDTFLNKTLGGFAPSTGESWNTAISRMYEAGEKIEVIVAEVAVARSTIHRSLRRQGILRNRTPHSLATIEERSVA